MNKVLIWVVVVGLLASGGAWFGANAIDRLNASRGAEQTALELSATVQARFGNYRTLIENVRAAMEAGGLNWASFTTSLRLSATAPGLYELSYIGPASRIGTVPSCTVQDVAPAELAASWVGFDACHAPDTLAALTQAAKTGDLVIAGSSQIEVGGTSRALVGLFAPVGQGGAGGFVMAHVDAGQLLADVVPSKSALSVQVFEGDHYDASHVLYQAGDPTLNFVSFETPVVLPGGATWYLVLAVPFDVGPLPWAAAGVGLFITFLLALLVFRAGLVRVRAESLAADMSEKYAAAEVRMAGILANVSDGIFRARPDWTLDYVNGALATLFGYKTPAEQKSRNPHLVFADPQAHKALSEKLQSAGSVQQAEVEFTRVDGTRFLALVSVGAVRSHAGEILHYDGAVTDITLKKEQEKRIHDLAFFDTVTKLPNRQHMMDSLERYLAHAKRAAHTMAVMFIDLDRFKLVNDTLGHHIGDLLLCAVADRLKLAVRAEDLVCRQGGDEFVVMMPHVGTNDEIALIADRLVRNVGKPYELGEEKHEVRTSPSIGIAVYPEDGTDMETLLKHADIAMFAAKDSGKNTYRYYSPEMESQASERMGIETDLAKALQQKELLVEYAPIASLPKRGFRGVEAELRWKHPRHGLLEASQFMTIAAQSDLAVDIGNWQVQLVFEQAARWKEQGLGDIPVSIPVTEAQLKRGGLPELIAGLCRSHKRLPNLLTLRISGRLLTTGNLEAMTALTTLRRMAVKIAIADFSADKGPLALIPSLKFDEVIISGKFLEDVPQDPAKTSMAEGLIGFAAKLGIPVVAKGVEVEAQLAFLRQQGCQALQGRYYCPPVTADKLADFARAERAAEAALATAKA